MSAGEVAEEVSQGLGEGIGGEKPLGWGGEVVLGGDGGG